MNLRHPAALGLIGINVFVFAILAWQLTSLLMNDNASSIAILHAGANLNPLTLGGEPWRIITSMFLHGGVLHLAMNMYALWSLGALLEPEIGSLRFLLLYFIAGIVAGIASLLFNVFVVSVGASGAIFGLYGYVLGAELIRSYRDMNKLQPVLVNFVIFLVVNVFVTNVLNIDLAGHVGGCIAGTILAACHFKFGVIKRILAMGLVVLLLPLILFFLPKDQVEYYTLFQRVLKEEKNMTRIFDESTNDQAIADSLKKSADSWEIIRRDLSNISSLPVPVAEDTAALGKYISLRIQEIDYKLHVIDESYIYLDSVEEIYSRFDSVPALKYILKFDRNDEEPAGQDTSKAETKALELIQVYYDKDWKEISSFEEAVYYRMGTRDSLNRWQGTVRDFYKAGAIQMKGSYKDGLRNGVFIYYSDHHTYSSAGRYEMEYPAGKWEQFHWNGTKESEVFYSPAYYARTMWDSTGGQQVANGFGEYKRWHNNGVVAEQGQIMNGRREGYWSGFHDDGRPYYKELYRDNRLISGRAEDKGGRRYQYDGLSEIPVPVEGLSHYQRYLERSMRYPAGETKHGTVKVLFNVGADGSMWDFVILKSISPACDQEAIRLVKEGPKWHPAFSHGDTKITSQGLVDVEF